MQRNQVVINTIAFMGQLERGSLQHSFFKDIAELGIQHVEVRQEYFGSRQELRDTAREAQHYNLKLLYSVPKQLFRNGQIDTEMVEQTLLEAKTLTSTSVKWTRGDFQGWKPSDISYIQEKASEFGGLLTVENDQTAEDGTVEKYAAFLSDSRDIGVPLFSTFDVGNWMWVGEDPVKNAQNLNEFVRYIHVKDAVKNDGIAEAKPVGTGDLPLTEVLSKLPKTTLVALEYPCNNPVSDELEKGIRWLEQLQL